MPNLTDNDVEAIKLMLKDGFTIREIYERLQVPYFALRAKIRELETSGEVKPYAQKQNEMLIIKKILWRGAKDTKKTI